jgi:hypothetical protein
MFFISALQTKQCCMAAAPLPSTQRTSSQHASGVVWGLVVGLLSALPVCMAWYVPTKVLVCLLHLPEVEQADKVYLHQLSESEKAAKMCLQRLLKAEKMAKVFLR